MSATTHPEEAFRPAERIGGIGVSEILRITAEAGAPKRSGRPVIVLEAGEPDFDTPDNVEQAACRAIAAGATEYTGLDGTPEPKEAVWNKFLRENGLDFGQGEANCGAGANRDIHNAFMGTLDQGDEVVIPAPTGRATATSSPSRAASP